MSSVKQSFQDGCDTIVAGCTSYGSTPSSNSPSAIVTAIRNIYNNRYNAGVSATQKGNATAGNVLSGKTFTSTAGVNLSGTMANRGALNWNPSGKESKVVSAGYYSGGTLNTENAYNAGYNAGQQNAAVSFTQTRASQISFYNPGYHYFDISASEASYDYLIVSGWFSGSITAVEVSNGGATKVIKSKVLSTGEGTNTMVHCILQTPKSGCRVMFDHAGSGNGYVIVYGVK